MPDDSSTPEIVLTSLASIEALANETTEVNSLSVIKLIGFLYAMARVIVYLYQRQRLLEIKLSHWEGGK